MAKTVSTSILNFNPLPRKEGDKFNIARETKSIISIHSLVKRETLKKAIRIYYMIDLQYKCNTKKNDT